MKLAECAIFQDLNFMAAGDVGAELHGRGLATGPERWTNNAATPLQALASRVEVWKAVKEESEEMKMRIHSITSRPTTIVSGPTTPAGDGTDCSSHMFVGSFGW
eukprot:Hpha_TRINITY_DN16672_c1_g9::TRINITY_DN16672_c1_g9_i2::g.178953::m.178953